jgi:hypothetical protein
MAKQVQDAHRRREALARSAPRGYPTSARRLVMHVLKAVLAERPLIEGDDDASRPRDPEAEQG